MIRNIPIHQKEELIENYLIQHFALGATAVRDYKKTILVAITAEIQKLESTKLQLENRPDVEFKNPAALIKTLKE